METDRSKSTSSSQEGNQNLGQTYSSQCSSSTQEFSSTDVYHYAPDFNDIIDGKFNFVGDNRPQDDNDGDHWNWNIFESAHYQDWNSFSQYEDSYGRHASGSNESCCTETTGDYASSVACGDSSSFGPSCDKEEEKNWLNLEVKAVKHQDDEKKTEADENSNVDLPQVPLDLRTRQEGLHSQETLMNNPFTAYEGKHFGQNMKSVKDGLVMSGESNYKSTLITNDAFQNTQKPLPFPYAKLPGEGSPVKLPSNVDLTQKLELKYKVHKILPKQVTVDVNTFSVGNFNVISNSSDHPRCTIRLKVFFENQHLIYEFPLAAKESGLTTSYVIIVPFATLTGINVYQDNLYVWVKTAPTVYSKPTTKRRYSVATEDNFTHGQLRANSMHYFTLKTGHGNRLLGILHSAGEMFARLLSAKLSTDPSVNNHQLLNNTTGDMAGPKNMSYTPAVMQNRSSYTQSNNMSVDTKSGKRRRLKDSSQQSLQNAIHTCSCRASCRTQRCPCMRSMKRCEWGSKTTCMCEGCDNPLNVLDSMSVQPLVAMKDECFALNIYNLSSKTLEGILTKDTILPCCNRRVLIVRCIPGIVTCPLQTKQGCSAYKLRYSWCRNILLDVSKAGMLHCSTCKTCVIIQDGKCVRCKSALENSVSLK